MSDVASPVSGEAYNFELVLVSYFSRQHLQGQLALLPPEMPIVIVDNARGSDRVHELVADRPFGRYVDSGGDRGFATAANLGVATSRSEYVVFGNPDSRPTVEIMRELVAAVQNDPNLASCSALGVGSDGRPELGAGGWEPSIRRVLVHATGLHLRYRRGGVWARPRVGEDWNLDWIAGVCMAVRRATFLELGGWDERYYVYNEDMQFGRTVRNAGLRQQLRTDLQVAHVGDSGAGNGEMLRIRGASMAQYLHLNNRPASARTMWSILVAGTVARIAHARLTGERERQAAFQAYLDGLRQQAGTRPAQSTTPGVLRRAVRSFR